MERECIDVSIPLQALVKESKLISPEKNSKVYHNGIITLNIGTDMPEQTV